jgi:regulator of protease activity HflC (stomatin/prohibitin superfamily)
VTAFDTFAPAVMLLARNGDKIAPIVMGLAGALGGIFTAIAAAKKRKQQAAEGSSGKPTRVGAVASKKERKMAFVPMITGKSSMLTRTDGAASHIHPVALFWFFVWLLIGFAVMIPTVVAGDSAGNDALIFSGLGMFFVALGIAFLFLFCLKVADQWDRVVVLRLGKFKAVQEPGIFWLIPFVDTVAKWIDTRVMTSDLLAEETLTRDTVPVDVDAVMFWMVYDSRKAALEVEDFESAVTWAAQTALRDLIGKTELAELLVGRDVLDARLQEIIDERTEPWGVTVQSVEIREIKIPRDLQDTMSRQAQAERERQARVILGESEKQIAQSFADAAEKYKDNPTALHLRAMNMLFEGLKEKGSLMIVPSSALDSMNLGAIGGMASLGMHAQHSGAQVGEAQPPAQ